MPLYDYIDVQGAHHEHFADFADCVPIGDWTEIDGVSLRRVASQPVLSVSPELRVTGYTMANDHPALDGLGLARDEFNNPLFDGKKDIDRFNAASQRLNDKDPTVPAFGWDIK